THGWIVSLWICGYMVVPLIAFGALGKRLARLSRQTGAITVPDLFRERFESPALGLTASLFILFFMSVMMVAQFKAGALVMKLAWPSAGTLALAEDTAAYRLTSRTLLSLEATGLPVEICTQLAELEGRGFETADDLKQELGRILSS